MTIADDDAPELQVHRYIPGELCASGEGCNFGLRAMRSHRRTLLVLCAFPLAACSTRASDSTSGSTGAGRTCGGRMSELEVVETAPALRHARAATRASS